MIGEWILVIGVALGASLLTLFSGFGLGTLLLPAFAFIFPLEIAVAATAVVHLANNIWKGTLFRGNASWRVVLLFGVPAMVAAFVGAFLLLRIPPTILAVHKFGDVTALGLIIGSLIMLFAAVDLLPRLKNWSVDERHLIPGGILSGFFGGLSGHQGALRSIFLTKAEVPPAAFVATGTMCAIMVDVARLTLYGIGDLPAASWLLVAGACIAAFLGAVIGKRLIGKVTMSQVRSVVGGLLLIVGLSIAAGLI